MMRSETTGGTGGVDPQLVEVATRFVNEVLEKAKEEAIKRLKERQTVHQANAVGGHRGHAASSCGSSTHSASVPPTAGRGRKMAMVRNWLGTANRMYRDLLRFLPKGRNDS